MTILSCASLQSSPSLRHSDSPQHKAFHPPFFHCFLAAPHPAHSCLCASPLAPRAVCAAAAALLPVLFPLSRPAIVCQCGPPTGQGCKPHPICCCHHCSSTVPASGLWAPPPSPLLPRACPLSRSSPAAPCFLFACCPYSLPCCHPPPARRRPRPLTVPCTPGGGRRARRPTCRHPTRWCILARAFTMVWSHFIAFCRASLASPSRCALPPGLRRTEHNTTQRPPPQRVVSLPFTCFCPTCLPTVPTPSCLPAGPPGQLRGQPSALAAAARCAAMHCTPFTFISTHSDANFVCEQFFHRGRRKRHPQLKGPRAPHLFIPPS